MYCKYCGKQLSDEAIICPQCGTPTKPLTAMPTAKEDKTATNEESLQKSSPWGAIGFFLSMVAFVTSIVFGAFMYVYTMANLLVLIIGSASILPALAGISIGMYALKNAKGTQKALAITGIVLASVALLFLFLSGCLIVSGSIF